MAGQLNDGTWQTQAWLINKNLAHTQGGALVADHPDAQDLIDTFEDSPAQIKGDVFTAKD